MSGMGTYLSGGNTRGNRSPTDFYPTPPEVTQALIDFLGIPQGATIWEPAAGEHDMVNVLEKGGYNVIATDIATGTDFLNCDLPDKFDWVITNPPFSKSEEFIKRCLDFDRPFAMLLKSQYWHARSRYSLFKDFRPSYVLPLTWRPDFLFKTREDGKRGNSVFEVAWNVWIPQKALHKSTIYLPLSRPE